MGEELVVDFLLFLGGVEVVGVDDVEAEVADSSVRGVMTGLALMSGAGAEVVAGTAAGAGAGGGTGLGAGAGGGGGSTRASLIRQGIFLIRLRYSF